MKKVLSILLLLTFLFNVGGYYLVYWTLSYQTDQRLLRRLDTGHYDEESTIELKFPVALPYPLPSGEFERINGRFEHEGGYFRLVKQKLENDTLFVICIRDHETESLVSTIKDYVELAQGLPSSSPSQKALQFWSRLAKDFCSREEMTILHLDGYTAIVPFCNRNETPLEISLPVLAPPPRV